MPFIHSRLQNILTMESLESTHPQKFGIPPTSKRTSAGLRPPRGHPRLDYYGSARLRKGPEKDESLAAKKLIVVPDPSSRRIRPLIRRLSSIETRRIKRIVDPLQDPTEDFLNGFSSNHHRRRRRA